MDIYSLGTEHTGRVKNKYADSFHRPLDGFKCLNVMGPTDRVRLEIKAHQMTPRPISVI